MDFNQSIPEYLLEKDNVTKLILWTAAFALVFINIYEPFGSREWLSNLNDLMYFALSSALIIIGMAIVAVSRIIMYYRCGKKHGTGELSLWAYLVWIAAEVIAMSLSFTLLEIGMFNDEREFYELLKISSRNTAFILLLPYSILWLYFSWSDKNRRLNELVGNVGKGSEDASSQQKMTNFYDSKGDVKFSVKLNDLLYIKGADNYITIFYNDNQKLSSAMVRNSMKSVEEDLRLRGIIRCHRSYMVNTRHIKILERSRDGVVVKLDSATPISIPVSRTFVHDVFELLG